MSSPINTTPQPELLAEGLSVVMSDSQAWLHKPMCKLAKTCTPAENRDDMQPLSAQGVSGWERGVGSLRRRMINY